MFTARFIKRSLGADLWVKVALGVLYFQKKRVSEQSAYEYSEFWHRKTDPANWMNPPS